MKLVDEFGPHPIYVDEGGQLYVYYPDSGSLYELRPGNFIGKVGQPMPGSLKGHGSMTCIGLHTIGDI